jgi:hypothetical protein
MFDVASNINIEQLRWDHFLCNKLSLERRWARCLWHLMAVMAKLWLTMIGGWWCFVKMAWWEQCFLSIFLQFGTSRNESDLHQSVSCWCTSWPSWLNPNLRCHYDNLRLILLKRWIPICCWWNQDLLLVESICFAMKLNFWLLLIPFLQPCF